MQTWILVENGKVVYVSTSERTTEDGDWIKVEGPQALYVSPGDNVTFTEIETTEDPIEVPVITPTREDLASYLKSIISSLRDSAADIGIKYKGNSFKSDLNTLAQVVNKIGVLEANKEVAERFKAINGFVDLKHADFVAIQAAITQHIQHVFYVEDELIKLLDQASDTQELLNSFNTGILQANWNAYSLEKIDYDSILTPKLYVNHILNIVDPIVLPIDQLGDGPEVLKDKGWLLFEPPTITAYDKIVVSFDSDAEDTTVVYDVGPADMADALPIAKEMILAEYARVSDAGITVDFVPFTVPSTKENLVSLNSIAQAYSEGDFDPETTINYSVGENFVSLDKDQVSLLKRAVLDYQQECFDRRVELLAAVNDLAETGTAHDIKDFLELELTEGWPV